MEITSHFVDGKDWEKGKLAQVTFRGYFFSKHQFEFLLIERKILSRKNCVANRIEMFSILCFDQHKKGESQPWTA